jgi:hypothetical protein
LKKKRGFVSFYMNLQSQPSKAKKVTPKSKPKPVVSASSSQEEEEEEVAASKYDVTECVLLNGSPNPRPETIEILALDPTEMSSVDAFQEKFDEIAATLVNDYILDVNGRAHRLAEVEFYLNVSSID